MDIFGGHHKIGKLEYFFFFFFFFFGGGGGLFLCILGYILKTSLQNGNKLGGIPAIPNTYLG